MGIFLQTVGISPSVFMDFPLHTMGRHCTFADENNINITNLSKNRQLMMYHTYIEASKQSLTMLKEKFTPVAEDRFIYSLQQRKWDVEDVIRFKSMLEISYSYTIKEYERLKDLSMVYNQEYPTNHAQYISTAQKLMAKMRSTLAAFKKIADKFQHRKKHCRHHKKDVSPFKHVAFHGMEYSRDIFGMESYSSEHVKSLLKVLNQYLDLADRCLDLCLQVIAEEEAVRANPETAFRLYKDSFLFYVRNNNTLIKQMIQNGGCYNNRYLKAISEAEDIKQMIAELYHKLTYDDFNFYCACKAVSDGRNDGMTPEESLIFGKDKAEKVRRINILLDHIAEVAESRHAVSKKTGKLRGDFFSHLLYWCGWDGRKNELLYNYIRKRCEGKVRVLTMHGVMVAKNNNNTRTAKQDVESLQQQFNTEMEAFVDSILNAEAGERG